MYYTTRYFFPHGIKGEETNTTRKEFETLEKAIAYAHRYANGSRFAGVQIQNELKKVVYIITQDGTIKDYTESTEEQTVMEDCLNMIQDTGIAGALVEYHYLVKAVAEDYTNETTVEEIRNDHPELDFMDNEQIIELLECASQERKEQQKEEESKEEPVIVEEKGVVTVREKGVVIAISKSIMNVPELRFNGIGIKWYEDKVRKIPTNKEVKMKPIKIDYDYACPRCKCNGIIAPYYALSKEMASQYCNRCGQALDWDFKEE